MAKDKHIEQLKLYKEYLLLCSTKPELDFTPEDYSEDDIKSLLDKSYLHIGSVKAQAIEALNKNFVLKLTEDNLIGTHPVKIAFWLTGSSKTSFDDVNKLCEFIFSVFNNEDTRVVFSTVVNKKAKAQIKLSYILWLKE